MRSTPGQETGGINGNKNNYFKKLFCNIDLISLDCNYVKDNNKKRMWKSCKCCLHLRWTGISFSEKCKREQERTSKLFGPSFQL